MQKVSLIFTIQDCLDINSMANQPEGVYCVYDQISIYLCKFVGTVVVNI